MSHFSFIAQVLVKNADMIQQMALRATAVWLILVSAIPTQAKPIRLSQYIVDGFNFRSGLPEETINSIAQTPGDGYLWMASANGLIRFDGQTFKIFRPRDTPTLAGSLIRGVIADHNGVLWMWGREGGFGTFQNGQFKSVNTPGTSDTENLSPTGQLASPLVEDSQHRIWVPTTLGLFRVEDGKMIRTALAIENEPGSIISTSESYDHRLWFGKRDGTLCVLDTKGNVEKLYSTADGLNGQAIRHIKHGPDGEVWLGTDAGLLHRKQNEQRFQLEGQIGKVPITAILVESNEEIWIGTAIGLRRMAGGITEAPVASLGLPNDPTESIFKDQENNIWLTNRSGGLVKFRRPKVLSWGPTEDLSSHLVHSSLVSPNGDIWMSSAAGLDVLRHGFIQHFTIPTEGLVPRYIEQDRAGQILVATLKKIFFVDSITGRVLRSVSSPEPISSILSSSKGVLVVTTTGIRKLLEGKLEPMMATGLPDLLNKRTYLAETTDGSLYMGSRNLGLYKIEGGHATAMLQDVPAAIRHLVHCLYSDRDGALWVGFDGAGLGRLKGGKLTRFTDGKDSPLSFIYQIGLTKGGNLWLGLRSGLMQVNFKELNDYLDGRVSAVTRRTYTAGDGLSSSNFGFPYGSRRLDPSDSVWMSSLRNIVQLSDTPLEVNRVPPRINFNGLVLDDKSVSVTNGVATFHSKIQTIRVNFDVPSFQDHSALTVEYQLEGLTNDWHRLSSSSFVNFTKLIPGDYVFRLRAANNDGVMSEPKELVRFKVLPAFHQTWWFFGLLFLAVVGLVVIVIRWRTGALLSRNRELEDGVKSRTKELEWATRQAEAAVHAKSEFLAVMSHEIRTPMNGVMGTLELLSMTELSREQREHVATVRSSSDLLLSLLNDVLDLSKLEVHRMELENVPFSLEQIVEEVAKPMRITAQLKGIDFLMQYSSGIPRVFSGDPIRLRQVLFNLCSNAVKFTETGTVKIIVHGSLQPSELWEIRIGVEDTGIGIEQDRLGVLFENFSQVDSSFARRFGGSGLGLAISKKLVGLMNGSFEVISEIGKGSQFWCVVPLVAADPSLVAKPVKNIFAGELPQFGVRVLLAEDNAVNQTVARRQLEKLGCFVDIANNGRQALEKYKANDYEIIFMDCQMPEMDGFEATARIRALPAKGEKPVIIALTANSMSGDRDRCIAAGMNDYLSKPYEFEALIAILTRHLKSASISMRQQ